MYVFDNAMPLAAARLQVLAQVFDAGTIRHLDARGITSGWRCLEVGGGLGTITRWLAERVGRQGTVVTTDIDTRYLATLDLPNVEVRHHNIVEDTLPEREFDLAYTRLVLQHVPHPDRALARMVRAIKPLAWIVVEDMEAFPAALEPNGSGVDPLTKTAAAMRLVTHAAGADARFGRSLGSRLRAAGLTDVTVEGRVFLWRAGSAGAALTRLNYEQLREPILATGQLTAEEFAADVARVDDEEFETRSPILWTAWGRRPSS